MQEVMKKKAIELLASGEVARVIGWKKGEFAYDATPAIFNTAEEIEKDFVYDDFTAANVSKYLLKVKTLEGKTLVFLKPCDTYSLNQLTAEKRIDREKVYVVGVGCEGKADVDKIKAKGISGIVGIESDGDSYTVKTVYGDETVAKADVMADRCITCKSKKLATYDEIIGEDGEEVANSGRFDLVEKLEQMTSEERFAFWQGELSRCIRCNACRNVCPACTCEQCIFDNPNTGVAQKAAADSFEEKLFHIIRAYHVAGRCTDCGECSRVCPEHIPLHLLNRKFIKDMDELYGDYQAGEDEDVKHPLISFTYDDAEPSIVRERGAE
ncbi:MAG: 4Fe-4S dicluster domain-containing protein [Clostridia bacterium]|nr:4Fe-4S dicluster domain-containing protein [Clostridia bacterium]